MTTPPAPPTNDWRTQAANQTRLAFGQALLDVATRDPMAVVLSADTQGLLGIRPYMARYPERFIEVGIAEQNMIGIASGLATTGLHAYVCSYAPFISARSMEQMRNDVAYAHQRVVIGAAASGIALGVSGGTHHALEDLALMRSLPHMTVIVPADVDEAYAGEVRHESRGDCRGLPEPAERSVGNQPCGQRPGVLWTRTDIFGEFQPGSNMRASYLPRRTCTDAGACGILFACRHYL